MNFKLFVLRYNTIARLMILIGSVILMISCRSTFNEKWTQEQAPDYFKARFETSKGNFDIEAKRSWSPHAVDRLYQLIKHGYFTDIAVYRVIPNYIAQFGIHSDSAITKAWDNIKVDDEVVIEKNLKGTISFARGGPQTRTNNLFINLKNNSPRLDTLENAGVKGYPVVAKITSGIHIVDSFYSGYKAELDNKQDTIMALGNTYLKKRYPKLDYINKAYILKN